MWKRVDWRLIGIAGALLLVSLLAAWAGIALFRLFFPDVSADTVWDELAGLPIAALVSFAIKNLLLREHVFHLSVVLEDPRFKNARLYILRRRDGRGILLRPAFHLEASVSGRETMVRNISWWGVYGVDACLLRLDAADGEAGFASLVLPPWLTYSYDTIVVKSGELETNRPLLLSARHVEKTSQRIPAP